MIRLLGIQLHEEGLAEIQPLLPGQVSNPFPPHLHCVGTLEHLFHGIDCVQAEMTTSRSRVLRMGVARSFLAAQVEQTLEHALCQRRAVQEDRSQ